MLVLAGTCYVAAAQHMRLAVKKSLSRFSCSESERAKEANLVITSSGSDGLSEHLSEGGGEQSLPFLLAEARSRAQMCSDADTQVKV